MFQGIDKMLLVNPEELWIYYTHRDPVVISGPDAWATWLWMHSPSKLTVVEFTRALVTDLEATQAAA